MPPTAHVVSWEALILFPLWLFSTGNYHHAFRSSAREALLLQLYTDPVCIVYMEGITRRSA